MKLNFSYPVFITTLFLALSAGLPCHAQLGKIPKANDYELGKPVKSLTDSGYLIQTYEKDGLVYKIFYLLHGKAILAHISQKPPSVEAVGAAAPALSDSELTALLARNVESSRWIEKPRQQPADSRIWEREDGKVLAEYAPATGMLVIGIRSAMPERVKINPFSMTILQLCLTPNMAFPPMQCVYGLKTGFMSGNGRVVGVEGTLVSASTPEVVGLKGAIVNTGDGSRGAHFGIVNVECDFGGLQTSLVNVLSGKLPGLPPPKAMQFGVVNYAKALDGFQFGLVNIIDHGSLPFMVIFNFDSPEEPPAE